jgi:hypothetical protein
MSTHMVRKQIYIHKRHDMLLKQLSQARGVSEAEIIRQAIERETAGAPAQPTAGDRSAWQELMTFLEARQAAGGGHKPYRWNREEIYAEREGRWLRDREKD